MSRFRVWAGLALAAVAAGALYLVRSDPVTTPNVVSVPVQSATAPPAEVIESPPVDTPSAGKNEVVVSSDPFEFIRGLAKAAYDGDAKAQFLVSRELDRCEYTLALVRKEKNDPETAILNFPWIAELKERTIAEYRRCIRLMKEDPFADLPPRKEGYPFQYWMRRSAQAGYPLAVVSGSLKALALPTTMLGAEKVHDDAMAAIARAAVSDEPDAALTVGFHHYMSLDQPFKKNAAAWMLAACRMGADCGVDSKVFRFDMCLECPAGMDIELALSTGLGAASYADAYAQSQAIEEALRGKDLPAVTQLLSRISQ